MDETAPNSAPVSRAVLQAMQGSLVPALAGGCRSHVAAVLSCFPRSCSNQCYIKRWRSRVRTKLLFLFIHAATGWRIWREGHRAGRPPKARPLDGGGSRRLH